VAKQLETVSGLVEQVNAKGTGIKVAGQWLNSSQFHAVTLPQAGQRVDVQVERTDRGVWIQAVDVLDSGTIRPVPQQPRRGGGRSPAELREIRRLSVLKAAAAFGASRPDLKSGDVLKIADGWLAWVEKGGRVRSEPG
jgi:hypothetical protein